MNCNSFLKKYSYFKDLHSKTHIGGVAVNRKCGGWGVYTCWKMVSLPICFPCPIDKWGSIGFGGNVLDRFGNDINKLLSSSKYEVGRARLLLREGLRDILPKSDRRRWMGFSNKEIHYEWGQWLYYNSLRFNLDGDMETVGVCQECTRIHQKWTSYHGLKNITSTRSYYKNESGSRPYESMGGTS